MLPSYYTVKGNGEHEIVIQKSRFIAHVARAETEEAAQAFIQRIKKENWNATHNCSAYLIGENDHIKKPMTTGTKRHGRSSDFRSIEEETPQGYGCGSHTLLRWN